MKASTFGAAFTVLIWPTREDPIPDSTARAWWVLAFGAIMGTIFYLFGDSI
ncbi:MAG: hypothetical protein WAU70_07150 [Flavobacteriales bacterium]